MTTLEQLSRLRCRAMNSLVGIYDAIDGICRIARKHEEIFDWTDGENTLEGYIDLLESQIRDNHHEAIEELYSAVVEAASVGDKMDELYKSLQGVMASVEKYRLPQNKREGRGA